MAKPKLSYFDFPGGRGEDCRLALFIADVEFEDDRVPGPQWPERKASTPFGAMPVLELPDRGKLAQSNAILPFIGRMHGLHPTDAWEAARHESLMASVEDLRTTLRPIMANEDKDKSKSGREAFAAGYMQTWGRDVSEQIEGPFVAGSDINVADLKIYVLLKWFVGGGVDHVPTDVFASHPKLTALFDAVAAHPKVAAWNERFAK